MNYTFKGNFGTLELVVDDNGNANGTFQKNGTLKGAFINNTFKGQWENKGMEGLIEFTITGDKLEGNWKKGLEPGSMRGKWEGEIIDDEMSPNSEHEDNLVPASYIIYFEEQKYSNPSEFIKNTNKLFESFTWENEKDCDEIADLYRQLNDISKTNVPKYGGYLYLFTTIADAQGEGEYEAYFEWNYAVEYGYDWLDLTTESKSVVQIVGEKYGQSEFEKYFPSLFLLTLLRIIDDTSAIGVAEYIVSNNVAAFKKTFPTTNDTIEDFVSDIVIELLKAIGYDINDYEGECTIEAQYFLDAGLDMGFNYLSLAEDFRDPNV